MGKQRYINTDFWQDPWVEENLDPLGKLLYLYLFTNPLTNIAGVYEITRRRIEFDTGLTGDQIDDALGRLERCEKVYYVDGWMILCNFPKHQKWESRKRIQEGIEGILADLPQEIRSKLASIPYTYPIKGYEYPKEGYVYDSNYSDSDSDTDTDTDTKQEAMPTASPKAAGAAAVDKFLSEVLENGKFGRESAEFSADDLRVAARTFDEHDLDPTFPPYLAGRIRGDTSIAKPAAFYRLAFLKPAKYQHHIAEWRSWRSRASPGTVDRDRPPAACPECGKPLVQGGTDRYGCKACSVYYEYADGAWRRERLEVAS